MNRRHIVIVSGFVPSQGTGSGIVLYRHVHRFCEAGTKVTIVAPEHSIAGNNFDHPMLQLFSIPKRKIWWPPVREWLPRSFEIRARLISAEIARRLEGQSPDSVLTLLWGDYPRAAVHLAKRLDVDLSVIIHDQEELWHSGSRRMRIKDRNKNILRSAAHVLPVSIEQAENYQVPRARISRLYPIPGHILYNIHAGVHSQRKPVVVSAGSIHEWQIDIFRLIARALELCNGKFVMISPASDLVCQAILAEFSSANRVDPFCENEEAVDFMSRTATAFLVSYAMDQTKQLWGRTSFPSKLLDFARAGVPPLVISPPETVLARWAEDNKLPLLWTRLAESSAADIAEKLTNPEIMAWARCHIRTLRQSEFDPTEIHAQLCKAVSRPSPLQGPQHKDMARAL